MTELSHSGSERVEYGGSMMTWIRNGIGIAIGFMIVSFACSACSFIAVFALTVAGVTLPLVGQ